MWTSLGRLMDVRDESEGNAVCERLRAAGINARWPRGQSQLTSCGVAASWTDGSKEVLLFRSIVIWPGRIGRPVK
jgi:hypothetical protein